MRHTRSFHRPLTVLLAAAAVLAPARPTSAQLDPLLFLKRTPPNVILVVDTSTRMLYDGEGSYYDPFDYSTGNPWDSTLGLSPLDSRYRRKYADLQFLNSGGDKFSASTIVAVGNGALTATAYSSFYARSRIGVAKSALLQAVQENSTSVRFGLVKTRQLSPSISGSNEGPVFNSDAAQASPSDWNVAGRWKVTRPTVGGNNYSQSAPASFV